MAAMSSEERHPWLKALGRAGPPERILHEGREYRLERVYKHDFFAATALYGQGEERIVLKLGRTASLFGLPLAWLGRMLAEHEARLYLLAEDLPGIPRFRGRHGPTGILHDYVPGHPLQQYERVDDDFFQRLRELLLALHERSIAYSDLEKRENILVDEQGRPALIDFQISWHWPAQRGGARGPARFLPDAFGKRILASLQASDIYHLQKHRRRHRRDQMTLEEIRASYVLTPAIRWHRRLSDPFQRVRRFLLWLLTGEARSPKQDGPEFLEEELSTHSRSASPGDLAG